MFMFHRIFVGIPVTQNNAQHSKDFLKELLQIAEQKITLPELQVYIQSLENPSNQLKEFSFWVNKNLYSLSQFKFSFHYGLYLDGENPAIFGQYVDNYFGLPDTQAYKVNFNNQFQINKTLENFKKVISTLPIDILKNINQDNLVGIWINNHTYQKSH